jgi:hypothetical protein
MPHFRRRSAPRKAVGRTGRRRPALLPRGVQEFSVGAGNGYAVSVPPGSVPPGPTRLRGAFRAGLRPRSRWLPVSALCLLLAGAIELGGSTFARWWSTLLDPRAPVGEIVTEAVAWWGILLLGGLGASVLVALASGRVGAVERPQERDLPGSVELSGWTAGALTALLLAGVAVGLSPVAAAARAAAASPTGLELLWASWSVRGLFMASLLLLGAGVVEHLALQRALWRQLHRTPAEARAEAQRAGRR